MNEKSPVYKETLLLLAGEGLTALLTVAVFLLIRRFDYTVALGAALGALVMTANFFFLAYSADRALMSAMEERGDREMSEEEAAEFASKLKTRVTLKVQSSFLLRMGCIIGVLVLAFVLDIFNPIATIVPMVAYRPIMSAVGMLVRKKK